MHIALEKLLIDDTIYPRVTPRWREILRYSMALKMGAKFPPIHVGKEDDQFVVIDGRHRVQAHQNVGRDTIPAFVVKLPRHDWFSEAVRLNTLNGVPLTYSERLSAAMRLQHRQVPMDEIARIVAIEVEQLENSIAERGFHAETDKPVIIRPLLLPRVKERGRKWTESHAIELDRIQRRINPNQGIHNLIEDLAGMVRNDLLPGDDETVVMVQRLEQLLTEWLANHQEPSGV